MSPFETAHQIAPARFFVLKRMKGLMFQKEKFFEFAQKKPV
jgi:hypothetical protein